MLNPSRPRVVESPARDDPKSRARTGEGLPLVAAPIVGRAAALCELRQLLTNQRARLITLTGAGGTGKSRLAIELAHELAAEFTNVWFVDLATVREAELVPSVIAQAIGVQEAGIEPLRTIFQQVLAGKPTLLVVDNFEQVTSAAAYVAGLLTVSPGLTIVVTSREALGVRAEHVYEVDPLPVPDPKRMDDAAAVRQVPSVQLFEDRARARRAGFELSDATLAPVAEICARLDGLPLAIELAAAQSAVLAPGAILKRLEARAPLLGLIQRDLPARHQTLHAVVGWSYELLEPLEQLVFRTCGVFAGAFSAEAVERICAWPEGPEDALSILAQLTGKSLVRVTDAAHDEPRFRLLQTIRDYAIEQLAAIGELEGARARHAAYYVQHAETLASTLRGKGMAPAINELANAYDNFRAVFLWAAQFGEFTIGLRLASALHRFWIARGPVTEARTWLESALPRSRGVSPALRAEALNAAGVLAGIQHHHPVATAYLLESLELWEQVGNAAGQARAQLNLGNLAYITGNFEEAQRRFERSYELFAGVGDRSGQARAVGQRARLAQKLQDLPRARDLLDQSLQLFLAADDDWGTAHSLANLGNLRLALGDRQGAATVFLEALRVWQRLGNLVDIAECFEGLAAVVVDAEPRRAVQLLGAAEALRERSGAPVAAVDQRRYEELVERARDHLKRDLFTAVWREGHGLSMERVIELARREVSPHVAPSDGANKLSPRELEIARLIARGQSNREIAERLIVTVKTVETHVQHMFYKLEVKNRAEIAVWAARHGLIES